MAADPYLSGCRTRRVSPAVAGRHLLVDARLKPQANLTGACVAFLLAARNQGTKPVPRRQRPRPRFPTSNHNRKRFSKAGANRGNAGFTGEMENPLRLSPPAGVVIFSTRTKKSAGKMDLQERIETSVVCR
jgi:hypothetical protein